MKMAFLLALLAATALGVVIGASRSAVREFPISAIGAVGVGLLMAAVFIF